MNWQYMRVYIYRSHILSVSNTINQFEDKIISTEKKCFAPIVKV